ncbi:MAG: hypothetical protein HN350_04040 [Phycisphaerales bacterium]|jgi:hypothetical protein|nr:hypothetical protein [Phycisphaerales bacterium]
MAIPTGTTSRQLGALVSWMYLTVVLAGLLTWWWPDYVAWGALIGGLLITLLLWLCWRTLSVIRTVPGHPIYMVLLIPAAVLTYHLSLTGLAVRTSDAGLVNGSLNASMLFHLAMLALAVMLSQSLLPKVITHASLVRICGAAMIGGGILAGLSPNTQPVMRAMGLIGYAGVAVWLEPMWRPAISNIQQGFAPPPYYKPVQIGSLVIAILASAALAWFAPEAAVLAAVGAGVALVTAAVIFAQRPGKLLITGVVLVIGGSIAGIFSPMQIQTPSLGGNWFGYGEHAFTQNITSGQQVLGPLSASDTGLVVLCRTIGTPATILTILGLIACLITFMIHARRDHAGDKAKCVAWTIAAMLCTGALLGQAGLFIPTVVLAAGLTWGLAPEAAGRSSKQRPGITILTILAATMMLMGVARATGLVVWSTGSLWTGEGSDKLLHVIFGLMMAMMMAWLMGSKKLIWGLAGISLACLVGGAGEIIQYVTSTGRSLEWTDWGAHASGCLAATVPYILCIGARQCESSDAMSRSEQMRDPYAR